MKNNLLHNFLDFDYNDRESLGALQYIQREISKQLDSLEQKEVNLLNKYSAVPTEFLAEQIKSTQTEAEVYRRIFMLVETCIHKVGG